MSANRKAKTQGPKSGPWGTLSVELSAWAEIALQLTV